MTARFIVSDVFDGLATLEDGSVDLVVTSPPFLALRSYLPADHPEKSKEIGSEATPAEFLDVMLRVTAELRRVLASHGSICIELGDTYAGSGGGGGDYLENGWRVGQQQFAGSQASMRESNAAHWRQKNQDKNAWPLSKSRTLIPQLYEIALAYGINPLTGSESPAGKWRIRNVVTWARPNPPVGALGDKWRPATSDLIVACTSSKRYWDDLATRKPHRPHGGPMRVEKVDHKLDSREVKPWYNSDPNPSGAPLLDYWEIPRGKGEQYAMSDVDRVRSAVDTWHRATNTEQDDLVVFAAAQAWLELASRQTASGAPLLDYWEIPPTGYSGSHYAVFPPALVEPCVKAMCPPKVCLTCGEPSRRIVEKTPEYAAWRASRSLPNIDPTDQQLARNESYGVTTSLDNHDDKGARGELYQTLGWTDCGHDNYRPGLILDPFAGSGTTLLVATGHGHDAIGIDIDARNLELTTERVGPFLMEIV